ncbi:hypothetical protein M0C34_04170 [Agarivorans sp. TSD2052]|uniref:hypothetical protein n=1 Tax=Agarivorans sp. TSD2052 TaxID=2937286 RepID=UPI00200CA1FC|nr:hypothetical protein [Agarivorans sp. TSD2052]UPW19483.1 hypothetical protein M0C34_04170 [Agarivorans sp. TSD2052]
MKELKGYRVVKGEGSVNVIPSGSTLAINLPGLVVENGFDVPALGSLWFTSNDSPYEETLYISLVDSQAVVIDHIELYKPYTPGLLKEVVANGNNIQFKFWQALVHYLSVDREKHLRLSRLLPPAGCYYASKLTPSYLTLSKI